MLTQGLISPCNKRGRKGHFTGGVRNGLEANYEKETE